MYRKLTERQFYFTFSEQEKELIIHDIINTFLKNNENKKNSAFDITIITDIKTQQQEIVSLYVEFLVYNISKKGSFTESKITLAVDMKFIAIFDLMPDELLDRLSHFQKHVKENSNN